MVKLTDSQLIVLSKAAAREDGAAVVPLRMNKAATVKIGCQTHPIGDKSPGHNQKDEERQKCKGDGYDHCCSARQGSLPQPMSRRSKNPCGTKSTFMPWPSFDREMRFERPPESGAMAERRGCLQARRGLMTAWGRYPLSPQSCALRHTADLTRLCSLDFFAQQSIAWCHTQKR